LEWRFLGIYDIQPAYAGRQDYEIRLAFTGRQALLAGVTATMADLPFPQLSLILWLILDQGRRGRLLNKRRVSPVNDGRAMHLLLLLK